ncbi:DUF6331 family protein [Larkinella terrae]|uniref:Uncharacterized protein n=1 Tax=Larkinella terrae TaxID=2025311 RepID=A0A7K0EDU1_9BACT|nr:DUF6331 family protein [Larkinella terrae]MRS59997.1 hypothetical protein [Larkinella terrae]
MVTQLKTLSIGPEKKIYLLDSDCGTDSVLEIKEQLGPFSSDITFKYSNVRSPLSQFWNNLETFCVAGCCGIDAFDFWPEAIVEAIKELYIETLVKQLERIKEEVLHSEAEIIGFRRLNHSFARTSFLVLIDYLITEVKQWL